jgi:hypothetical protein
MKQLFQKLFSFFHKKQQKQPSDYGKINGSFPAFLPIVLDENNLPRCKFCHTIVYDKPVQPVCKEWYEYVHKKLSGAQKEKEE